MSGIAGFFWNKSIAKAGAVLDLTLSPACAYGIGMITANPVGNAVFVFTQRAVIRVADPLFAKYFEKEDASNTSKLAGRTLAFGTSIAAGALAVVATGVAVNTLWLSIAGGLYFLVRTGLTLDEATNERPLPDAWTVLAGGAALLYSMYLIQNMPNRVRRDPQQNNNNNHNN